MPMRVYTDTSVFGGCFESEFKEWSCKLMEEFIKGQKIIVVSDITLKELSGAPEYVQELLSRIPENHREYQPFTDEAESLARNYIKERAVSHKFEGDAFHIAIATINHDDVLVSWNFKHIVNLQRIRLYNAVNMKYGYPLLEIRTPMEVVL